MSANMARRFAPPAVVLTARSVNAAAWAVGPAAKPGGRDGRERHDVAPGSGLLED